MHISNHHSLAAALWPTLCQALGRRRWQNLLLASDKLPAWRANFNTHNLQAPRGGHRVCTQRSSGKGMVTPVIAEESGGVRKASQRDSPEEETAHAKMRRLETALWIEETVFSWVLCAKELKPSPEASGGLRTFFPSPFFSSSLSLSLPFFFLLFLSFLSSFYLFFFCWDLRF